MNSTIVQAPVPVVIPERERLGRDMADRLENYLGSLLVLLDHRLDSRLVRTFAATVINIIRHRDRALSLLLTELGELLLDGAHAPAGVKRLERLLRSAKWTADLVSEWLLADADRAVEEAICKGGEAFLILDGSAVEKPTARKLEGLTKVGSLTALLLRRASGGPPMKPPIVVPGFGWVAAVVTGRTGSMTLARVHWHSPTAPDDQAQRQREAERSVLLPLLSRWGRKVLCLLDRGFDGREFLGELLRLEARFIVRWRPDYHLISASGEEAAASTLSRRVRSKWSVEVYKPYSRQTIGLGIASLPVRLPDNPMPLWLVVARRKGHDSWWLLTTEDASTPQGAINLVLAYARRWQVEWAFRFAKSDLGMCSIRVRKWAYREKLWAIASLVHAFLLHLLVLDEGMRKQLLHWCHRTGRCWEKVVSPIYRLRHALANIWNPDPPTLTWST